MKTNVPNVVTVSLMVLAALYCLITLSVSDNLITFLGALVMYKLTGLLLPTLAVFIIMPLVVYMKQEKMVKIVEKEEGFHTDGAVQISERVKKMQVQKNTGKITANPVPTTGVLESPEIESFQTMDASGSQMQEKMEGYPGVSVPAFVREKGRLLVVPESSVPRVRSDDVPPKPQTMVEGADKEGETTALVSDATKLPEPEPFQSMNVGPAELE